MHDQLEMKLMQNFLKCALLLELTPILLFYQHFSQMPGWHALHFQFLVNWSHLNNRHYGNRLVAYARFDVNLAIGLYFESPSIALLSTSEAQAPKLSNVDLPRDVVTKGAVSSCANTSRLTAMPAAAIHRVFGLDNSPPFPSLTSSNPHEQKLSTAVEGDDDCKETAPAELKLPAPVLARAPSHMPVFDIAQAPEWASKLLGVFEVPANSITSGQNVIANGDKVIFRALTLKDGTTVTSGQKIKKPVKKAIVKSGGNPWSVQHKPSKQDKSRILRFALQTPGYRSSLEIGSLPAKWTAALAPLFDRQLIQLEAECAYADACLEPFSTIILRLSIWVTARLFTSQPRERPPYKEAGKAPAGEAGEFNPVVPARLLRPLSPQSPDY
jgi:hypothetical protein